MPKFIGEKRERENRDNLKRMDQNENRIMQKRMVIGQRYISKIK